MPLALAVLALGCLAAATYLWQRSRKVETDGSGTRGTRIAIVALVLAGVLIALASQLPMLRA